ncbi:S-layer homology domain-containing protein [Paenibacillus andongensis]|uniref:S-layer homology domain-containing protein n=1 Tax=Paenibacillus andongensis TaxID=2975482 RepID=UPI0021BAC275|nr:S-layer homology domain-containing protein [Paenibacillus andongensis]
MKKSRFHKVKNRAVTSLLAAVLLITGTMPSAGPVQAQTQTQTQVQAPDVVVKTMVAKPAAAADVGIPVLDAMPAVSQEPSLAISGYADPEAAVSVWYAVYGGEERHAAPTIAHDDGSGRGRFALNLELTEEGKYSITASAEKDGRVSERSAPVVVKVDWTDAGDVINVTWNLLAYNRVMLKWDPPYLENGEPNPDVKKYFVYNDDSGEKVAETSDPSTVVDSLEQNKLYTYRIVTVDEAGNESSGSRINVGASPKSELKLADLVENAGADTTWTAISADGSTVVYSDAVREGSELHHLYAIDTASKSKETVTRTKDGSPPSGIVRDPKINRTGNIIVFTSNASNLTASPGAAGDHIYAYDRGTHNLELISSSEGVAADPVVSGDGRWIAFTEDNRVYVFDRNSHSRKLVSEALSGSENGSSYGPAISGNGAILAFLSDSSNLLGAAGSSNEQAIYIYDVAAASIVNRFVFNAYHSSLAVNGDGRYIAYTEAGGPGWHAMPYYFDRTTGETFDLNSGRSETELTHKTYNKLTISGSGKIVLANLVDTDPPVLYMNNYSEMFDRDKGKVVTAGNPALNAYAAAIDGEGNRIVYARGNALYTYCLNDCGTTGPQQPITSSYWSVPASSWTGNELKQGSTLKFQAEGATGLTVDAVIAYKQLPAGDDSSTVETKESKVRLPENLDTAGLYRGEFEFPAGTTEIVSVVVQLEDGSSRVVLDHLPVKVAGLLSVDIETSQPDMLLSSLLIVTNPALVESETAVSKDVAHYDIPLPSGEPYAIKLYQDQVKIALAQQTGLAIRNGAITHVKLIPVFTALLNVKVNYNGHPAEPAVVVFKKASDGTELAKVNANAQGEANLPGLHETGEKITVSVTPPLGFKGGDAQTITLLLGKNELTFELFPTSASVKAVTMKYARTVGQYGSEVPVMGSDASIEAEAKPGLHLEAFVAYLQWKGGSAPEAVETKIALNESEPGKYSGVFRIEEGVARIDAVYMEVDGERLTNRYAIDKNVAGRLKVIFDIPKGEEWSNALNKAGLTVFYFNDIYKRHYEEQEVTSGKLTYTFDVPYTGIPYRVTVKPWSSSLVPVQTDAPEFGFGQTGEITIKPEYMVQMKGVAKTESGQKVPVSYNLTDDKGAVLLKGNANGDIDLRLAADYGDKYRLQIVPSDPLYFGKQVDLTADALSKEIPMVLSSKPLHELTGRVVGTDGLPVSGATVTAIMDGKERTFQATTKSNGTYTLMLPAGTAKVRASNYRNQGFQSKLSTVIIPEDGGAAADFRLLDYASVDFKLYTKQLGSDWQGPITFDWRVAVHLGLKTSHGIMQYGPPMKVAAVAGDTFQICLNGYEADLPSACKEVTIGDDNQAAVEMRLESTGAQATASFAKPDGSNLSNVYLQMYQLNGEEAVYQNMKYSRSGNRYVIDLPSKGRYRMIAKGEKGLTSTVEFTVDAAAPLDLGRITLQAAGNFGGLAGNGIGTSSDFITPNGKVTARVTYNNSNFPAIDAANAVISLELPNALEPMTGTLIVNGQAKEFEKRNGKIEVPLGNVKAYQEGSLTLGLRVGDPGIAGNLPLTARIRYTSGGVEREEMLGTVLLQVVNVTLRVPETVVKPQFRVSGTAPAGSEVTVYDGSDMLGTAAVSTGGTWQLDVELKDTETVRHRIRTEALAGGSRVTGEESVIVYDVNDPGLEEVTLRQGDGRVQIFHPDNGVAVFPFVFVPGQPFVYKLKFRDTARISDVQIWNGDTAAEARLVNGEYVAAMTLTKDPGPIAVTYHKKADPQYIPPRPTEKELRATLPQALRNFAIESVTLPEEGLQEGQLASGKAMSLNIRLNETLSAKVSFTSSPVASYSPTERDLQLESQSGIPLYGSSLQHSVSDSGATASFSAIYPNRAGSGLRRTALLSPENVKIIVDLFSTGTKIYDTSEALNSLVSPSTADRITADIEAAQGLCDPQAAEYYSNMAEEIKMDIYFSELLKNAINWVGSTKFEGPQGLLFWVEGTWAGKQLDAVVDGELNELEYYLKQYDCKLKPYPKPPKKPAATPKYIYDPSGYVYEGMPANRLKDVTATVMELDSASGSWNAWDAEWYEQHNPQITDHAGRYGWDVPTGKWKVKFEKDGYETVYSNELDVPPPQLDVNIPMKSYAPPQVGSIRAYPEGSKVNIYFTKPIETDTATKDTVVIKGADGAAVKGAVKAIDPAAGQNGKQLAMAVEFTPETPLAAGGTYTVAVSGSIVCYAGVPLGTDSLASIVIEAADRTPPQEVAGLTGGLSADGASLVWINPDDTDLAGTRIRWKKAGTDSYGNPVDVVKGQEWAVVKDLAASEAYDFLVSTVDEFGNESAGARWSWSAGERRPDLAAPPTAADLKVVSTGKDQIRLAWTDPSARDLAKLKISWSPENNETKVQSIEVAKEIQAATITGLRPSTKYRIGLVAIDESGNESSTAIVTAETSADSGGGSIPGGGSGNPGSSGSGEQAGNAKAWVTGRAGGSFEAFDGKVKLEVKPDTFADDTKVTYATAPDPQVVLPAGYSRMSPSYLIDGESAKPGHSMRLDIAYDLTNAQNIDARQLGIYVKNSASASGWTYVGGTVDNKNHRIRANIKGFGEYAVMRFERSFTDMSSHWSRPDVAVLVSRHLVSGTTDDRFEPDRLITRAEITKLLVQGLQQSGVESKIPEPVAAVGAAFTDVVSDAWFAKSVEQAAGYGLIEGADGRFRPNDPITREELAVLFTRFAVLTGASLSNTGDSALSRFRDEGDISDWARKDFLHAVSLGWIQGLTEATAEPKDRASRAQATVMLLRVLDSLELVSVRP